MRGLVAVLVASSACVALAQSQLSDSDWAARVTVRPGFGTDGQRVGEERSLTVWHETRPRRVSLALGALYVGVEPGRLVAWHRADRSRAFVLDDAGATIADLIAQQMPPVWAPPLAMALTGDEDAWPQVGASAPSDGSVGMGRDRLSPEGFPTGMVIADNVEGLPLLELLTERLDVPAPVWPGESAERAAAMGDLRPPPDAIGLGDSILTIPFTNPAAARWSPVSALGGDDGRRAPDALVLFLSSRGAFDGRLLSRTVESARATLAGRAAVGGDATLAARFIARPVGAGRVVRDRLPADAALADSEDLVPPLVGPAGLADRFIRGAGTLIVVADRTGVVRSVRAIEEGEGPAEIGRAIADAVGTAALGGS